MTRPLRVETPSPWRRAVRPAAFAGLVVFLFVGGTLLARAAGLWHNSISTEEYARRIRAEWEASEGRAEVEGSKP